MSFHYVKPDGAVVTAMLFGPDGTYYVERWDNEPPRNRWRLIYPDGGYQRTRNKRDAERLAKLHATDRPAWSKEVTGI